MIVKGTQGGRQQLEAELAAVRERAQVQKEQLAREVAEVGRDLVQEDRERMVGYGRKIQEGGRRQGPRGEGEARPK